MPRRISAAIVLLFILLPGRFPMPGVSAGPQAAWAMPGQDAQRTAQGMAVGPWRASRPHLVLAGFTSDPPIIGADGTLYGFLDTGGSTRRLAAVRPDGRIRWPAPADSPRWGVEGEAYPILTAQGTIFFSGGSCPPPPPTATTPQCLTQVGADGHVRWHAVTQFLTKNLPRLLVRPDGFLVRATVGPSGYPIMVYGPAARPRPVGASCSWTATALGARDDLYAATWGQSGAYCPAYTAPDQGSSTVVAFTPAGARAWARPLPAGCDASLLTIDSRRARLYVAASCSAQPRLFALDLHGRILWAEAGAGSGTQLPALALDRAGGDVWLADDRGLQRIGPAGTPRWRRAWRAAPGIRVTLILDGRGTAYVGTADGVLRAVSPGGAVLWQYRFSGPRSMFQYFPPDASLGPNGALYVAGPGEAGLVAFAP